MSLVSFQCIENKFCKYIYMTAYMETNIQTLLVHTKVIKIAGSRGYN